MYTNTALLFVLSSAAQAHMSLWYPPPLGGAQEANPLTTHVDDEMNFPFGCCDSGGEPTLPSPGDCRGHLNLLDAEEGKPQVTWEPGHDAYFQLSAHTYTTDAPGSTHYGGSCQVGFSTDKGQTWKVAASYHGNCPHRNKNDAQTFQFKVPAGMPRGPAVFAWIWLNREHESFMNCASVQIGQASGNSATPSQSKRPSSSVAQPSSSTNSATQLPRNDYEEPTFTIHREWDAGSHRVYARHLHHREDSRYHMRAVDNGDMLWQHRPSLHKRALEACDWKSAPNMETSYYTIDANCAANAKLNYPKSDSFEIGWSDACSIVKGDGQYPIENIKC